MIIKSHFLFGIGARKKRDRQTNIKNHLLYYRFQKGFGPIVCLDSFFLYTLPFSRCQFCLLINSILSIFSGNYVLAGFSDKLRLMNLLIDDIKTFRHSIYIRTVSSQRLLSTFLIQLKLVYGPFRQSNMHSTLDFCPRPARKERNVPLHR